MTTVQCPAPGQRVLDPLNPAFGPVTVETVYRGGQLLDGVTDTGRPVSIGRAIWQGWTLADPTPMIP